jgi:hypothetical protein
MHQRSLVPALASLLFMACGGSNDTSTVKQAPALVIGGNDASEQAASIYQMPTPNELFAIVRKLDGKGQKSALSSAPDADRFATLSGRALNFGVYATDMVYASNFDLKSEVVRYYLASKKLGEQLGLSASFNGEVQQRLEKNLAHGDSLDVLANDAYFSAYQKLQEDRMGPLLSLVLAGGWVESMHLVMSKVETFNENDPLVARVAEQKASLEQLIDMMAVQNNDANLSSTREELIAIRDLFDHLSVVRTPNTGTSPSGRMVLGDDVAVRITSAQFIELRQAVDAFRDRITHAEDAGNEHRS